MKTVWLFFIGNRIAFDIPNANVDKMRADLHASLEAVHQGTRQILKFGPDLELSSNTLIGFQITEQQPNYFQETTALMRKAVEGGEEWKGEV